MGRMVHDGKGGVLWEGCIMHRGLSTNRRPFCIGAYLRHSLCLASPLDSGQELARVPANWCIMGRLVHYGMEGALWDMKGDT